MRRKRASHLAMMQQRAERVQTAQRVKAPARQGNRSVLCDGDLNVIQRERGRGNKRKGGEGGGVARRCTPQVRVSPRQGATSGGTRAKNAEIAESELRRCVKSNGEGKRGGQRRKKEKRWRGRGCSPQASQSPSHEAAVGGASAEKAESTESEVSV